jgi:hypothetical protein
MKTRKKTSERIIIKHTPLLPGLTRCHPRLGASKTRPSEDESCIPDTYKKRVVTAETKAQCGDSEYCMVEKATSITDQERSSLLKTHFRPKMPAEWKSKPNTWLSSDDIDNVMRQYEEAYPSFKFLGVVPIDFSAPDPYEIKETAGGSKKCLADQFCHVKLAEERAKGIDTIGAIFNLDPSTKSGSHWVACCILLKKRAIYYFDSYGEQPPEQVSRFMRSFILQDPGLDLRYNGRRFQYGGSECGMYSMYFVICMIEGVPFKKFVRHTVRDEYMLKMRSILFSS